MTASVEIKAYCKDFAKIKNILLRINAEEIGSDHQIDTYFHSKSGKLKLREGNVYSELLHYTEESGKQTIKRKHNTYHSTSNSCLKEILEKTIGSKCVVDKNRATYQLDNVYFHLDTVKGLGDFIKIESIDLDGSKDSQKIQAQCNQYLKTLEINAKDIVSSPYSELLQQNNLFNQILVDE